MEEITAYVDAAVRTFEDSALTDGEKRAQLRYILKKLNPQRQKVTASAADMMTVDAIKSSEADSKDGAHGYSALKPGQTRIPVSMASGAQLLDAIKQDAENVTARLRPPEVPYKAVEKMFRYNASPPCESVDDAVALGAIDFDLTAAWRFDSDMKKRLGITEILAPNPDATPTGSFAPVNGIYGLEHAPGFYFIPCCLSPSQQAYWVRRALRNFAEPPQRRNIDSAVDQDYSNLVADTLGIDSARVVRLDDGRFVSYASLTAEAPSPAPTLTTPTKAPAKARLERQLWRKHWEAGSPPDSSLSKLAWATLGCQYDWTARQYHLPSDPDYALHVSTHETHHDTDDSCKEDDAEMKAVGANRWYVPFPEDLKRWSADVAAACNRACTDYFATHHQLHHHTHGHVDKDARDGTDYGLPMSIEAQSGICNFYSAHKKLPMGAHVDDMERDHRYPVVSVSFGCAAIYLLGGVSKHAVPTPVVIRSGDIAILSGECRLAYHGVARVFEDSAKEVFLATPSTITPRPAAGHLYGDAAGQSGTDAEEAAFAEYLRRTRLNINVRQVAAASAS